MNGCCGFSSRRSPRSAADRPLRPRPCRSPGGQRPGATTGSARAELAEGTWTAESPWPQLEPGLIVYLEFDRQRYDAEGNWLAYVFLPNGRMLNAELVRLGLARPVADGRNARYLDLLHEMAGAEPRT
jgi:hypothetical protein